MNAKRLATNGTLAFLAGIALLGLPALARAAAGPDLVFSAFSAKVASGKVSISNTFKNQGTVATAGTFYGAFYLSTDNVISPSTDVLLGTRARTSVLDIGATNGATSAFSVPASVAPGNYYVIGVVDSTSTQTEANEANNVAVAAGTVAIKADLVVSSLSASRTGSTLSVKDTVKNQGPLSAKGPFRVDFYLSADATIATSDLLLGSRNVTSTLAYGATNQATTTLAIPAGLAAGSWRLGAIADGGGVVPETLENNNAKASSALSLLPDFTAVSVTASATGRTVTVTETVRNDGPVASPASKMDLRLSTDNSVGSSDPVLAQRAIPTLAPGASSTVTTTATAPAAVLNGAYYVGIWADAAGTVAEVSDSNNKLASAATVTLTDNPPPPPPPPPPANVAPVANVSASPTSGVAPLVVSFDGSASADSDGVIASYAWSFGDGQTGTGANVSHAYVTAGTYTATLTVTDDDGATASKSVTIVVAALPPPPPANVAPVANVSASPTSGMAPLAVSFNGSASMDSDGTIVAYAWAFGDGQTGTGATPTHIYASAGTYAATLTVTDDDGATNSSGVAITVSAPPPPPPPPSSGWSKAFGSAGEDRGFAVAADAAGSVFTAGYFSATVDFGGGPLVGACYPWYDPTTVKDIYVAKYTAAGAHVWSKRFGDVADDSAKAIAVTPEGDVVVTGLINCNVDLGNGVLTPAYGSNDFFIAKYSGADGRHLWSRTGGFSGGDSGQAIAVDASGNVYVAGTFCGSIDLGGGVLSAPGGTLDTDLFVAKYSPAGAHLWSKRFGAAGTYDYANALAVDASGNVILAGTFYSPISFGGSTLTSAGGYDAFVAKLSTDGAHVWSKRLGGASEDQGYAVAADAAGNVLVAGKFQGTANFGGSDLSSAGGFDVFVAKFSAAGVHQWSKRFGAASDDDAKAVAFDPSGNALLGGSFGGSVDFGGGALTSVGGGDAFIAKLSPAGAHVSSRRFGGSGYQYTNAMAFDGSGNTFAAGMFQGTIDFGQGARSCAGLYDAFVAKLAP